MLRAVLLAAIAISLAIPSAAALPIAGGSSLVSVAVGPDGPADPTRGDPYYLWVIAGRPILPHPSDGTKEDCGAGARPDLVQAADGVVAPILVWKPLTNIAFSGWFPQCIATEGRVCVGDSASLTVCPEPPAKTYVAYDVTDGSYFVSVDAPTPIGLKPSASYGGSTGIGMSADCVSCPQPP